MRSQKAIRLEAVAIADSPISWQYVECWLVKSCAFRLAATTSIVKPLRPKNSLALRVRLMRTTKKDVYITKRLFRLLVVQTQATSENCLNAGIAWQVHEAKPCQLVKFQIHHGWCSHHGVVLYEKLKCWHLGVAWSLHSSATRNDQF